MGEITDGNPAFVIINSFSKKLEFRKPNCKRNEIIVGIEFDKNQRQLFVFKN